MSGPLRVWTLLTAKREGNRIQLELEVEEGKIDRVTFGVGDDPHSYKGTSIGRTLTGRDADDELIFYITGPQGEPYMLRVTADDTNKVWNALVTLPKCDAAVFPYVVQQAAFHLRQAA